MLELLKTFPYNLITISTCICPHKDFNWWAQVEAIFESADLQIEFNSLSPEYLEEHLEEIVSRYCQNLVNRDVEEMQKDAILTYYNMAKTHITTSKYLQENITWQEKKLLMSLRSNFPSIAVNNKRVSLNAIWMYWKNPKECTPLCELCNLNELEDVFHVMIRCPHYKSPRNYHLKNYKSTVDSKHDLLLIVYKDDANMWNNFYKFWCEAFKIRQFFLNEMNYE